MYKAQRRKSLWLIASIFSGTPRWAVSERHERWTIERCLMYACLVHPLSAVYGWRSLFIVNSSCRRYLLRSRMIQYTWMSKVRIRYFKININHADINANAYCSGRMSKKSQRSEVPWKTTLMPFCSAFSTSAATFCEPASSKSELPIYAGHEQDVIRGMWILYIPWLFRWLSWRWKPFLHRWWENWPEYVISVSHFMSRSD